MIPLRDHNPSNTVPFVTLALIIANIYVFWQEITTPRLRSFIMEYALVPANVNFTDLETLEPFFTSMFLHGGWLHLISNMWFLWIFGNNVEDRLGKIRYLFFYIITGLAAGVSQYAVNPSGIIPMLGASGAVAGVLGAYLLFFPRHRIDTLIPFFFWLEIVSLPAIIMIGIWFLTQILAGFESLSIQTASAGGVAFFAHIGGFLAGLILASLYRQRSKYS